MRLFQAALDTPLDSPFFATLSVHGLHFTVCTPSILGSGFGRTNFRGFLFLGRRIFLRVFSPDFFSSFLWEKVPRKILQENPRENPPKCIQQKSSDTFLRIGRGKEYGTPARTTNMFFSCHL